MKAFIRPAGGSHRKWLILVILGVIARLVLAMSSCGSGDIQTWHNFGASILDRGMHNTYIHWSNFNHPPLAAYIVALLVQCERTLGAHFPTLLKLLSAFFDIGTAVLLLFAGRAYKSGLFGRQVCALYCIGLCPILISGLHGNTDSVCVFWGLLGVLLLQSTNRFFLSGLFLAVSWNVKLITLLLLPGMFSAIHSNKGRLFFLCGASLGSLPLLAGIFLLGDGFSRNVLGYVPAPNLIWGVQAIAAAAQIAPADLFAQYGKGLLSLLVTGIAVGNLISPRLAPVNMACLSFLIFTALAPAFSLQYTLYLCPFLLICSAELGLAYCTLSGLMLADIYFEYDRRLGFTSSAPSAIILSLLSWMLVLLAGYLLFLRRVSRG